LQFSPEAVDRRLLAVDNNQRAYTD